MSNEEANGSVELPNRSTTEEANKPPTDDIEANHGMENGANTQSNATLPPVKHEPIRTDPIKALEARKRRLDRQAALAMPEIHFVGQIVCGVNLTGDSTEGSFLRWKIDHGKAWSHLGGEVCGQTQVAYCRVKCAESLPFSHPLDVHFAEAGLQGWGAPRITIQSYRLDVHGRRILAGYGFAHLPVAPGPQRLEVHLWRPCGNSPEQELSAFLLGETPALVSQDPIYETAWRERCRLVTVTAGRVFIDLFVVARHHKQHGVDSK